MQGSAQRPDIQVLDGGQSCTNEHSGLQFGGAPSMSGKHLQTALLFTS